MLVWLNCVTDIAALSNDVPIDVHVAGNATGAKQTDLLGLNIVHSPQGHTDGPLWTKYDVLFGKPFVIEIDSAAYCPQRF